MRRNPIFATKEAKAAYIRAYKRHWMVRTRENPDYRRAENIAMAEKRAILKGTKRLGEKVWRSKVLDYARQEADDNGKPVREILERMGMPAEQIRKMVL